MIEFTGIFVLAIAFFMVAFLLYSSIRLLYSVVSYHLPMPLRDILNRHFILRPLKKKYRPHLKELSFYRSLTEKQRRYFEKRMQRFIDSKEFIHRNRGEVVTHQMEAYIAATAIQLTFYHPSIYLDHFYRILIYKTDYYSTITKMYHQGEVNARGFIVLSWDNFMRGMMDGRDGIHLGLHEMAHALQLENIIDNGEFDFLDRKALARFKVRAEEEIKGIKEGERTFFRQSAYFNIHEFFAVAVESFFERPNEFKNHDQEIYQLTADLLNIPKRQIKKGRSIR